MSSLERITEKIMEEAQKQVDESLESLEVEKARILAQGKKRALLKGEELIERARKDSLLDKERSIASAQLKSRDDILSKRLAILDECFEKAKLALRNLSDERYLAFVKKALDSLVLEGDERLIVAQDKRALMKGLIPLSEETCDVGFIIEKKGLRYNFQFDELTDYKREEIQDEIYRLLFSRKE